MRAPGMESGVGRVVSLFMGMLFASFCYGSKTQNLNGDYAVTAGDTITSDFNSDYSSKGHEFFDVISTLISTSYGQVYWPMQDAVDLPPEIVSRFANKTMAITGYEMDQVLESDHNTSVPINHAYNHHYIAWLLGADTVLEQQPCGEGGCHTHGHDASGGLEWAAVPRAGEYPTVPAPTSTLFSEGNGGESRKSFHGYPEGFAQLLFSPSKFQLNPMQIDTWNRNQSGSTFQPGPLPTVAQSPPNAVYSGLLECPCTDRIVKDLGAQTLCSADFGCHNFSITCAEAPTGVLADYGNKICSLETYPGGLQCCPHNAILLDADQADPWPDQKLVYRMVFRVWFEEYEPATTEASASHRDLPRLYWQTEAEAGECSWNQLPSPFLSWMDLSVPFA